MNIRNILILCVISILAGGCVVSTVGAVAKTGMDVGVGAAKSGIKVTGAVVDAAVPDMDPETEYWKREAKKRRKEEAKHQKQLAYQTAANTDNDPYHNELSPFDSTRDPERDINEAFVSAALSGRNVLIIFGNNRCHDSRGLAAKFAQPELASVIAQGYEVVWVDVGRRNRNLDVPPRVGIHELYGTPTIAILSSDRALLNRESVHQWRTADSKPYDETLAYFRHFASTQQ